MLGATVNPMKISTLRSQGLSACACTGATVRLASGRPFALGVRVAVRRAGEWQLVFGAFAVPRELAVTWLDRIDYEIA